MSKLLWEERATMCELRIGDRVRTPRGVEVVVAVLDDGNESLFDITTSLPEDWGHRDWSLDEVEPLPPDIPRERVADLHAAVVKRAKQLAVPGGGTVGTWLYAELSEVAEALRLLLEGGDDA